MHEGYGSLLSMCVSVSLSVTKLAATYLVYASQVSYQGHFIACLSFYRGSH